ncbi:L,D-transpeptidase family protein [Butyrivibrio sp. AE3004]|uniref:L,D-transpeptidase family protein n=1 Tax=Butyrivibrio sp. AE3004 TaxID=1506994 RepID=UPI0006921BC1|nr:L,D-transpeptidase/peptidoglycan binding protein [Butyrivibrio sp. AE3004]
MKRTKNKGGNIGIIVAIIIGLLAIIYLGISFYFTGHFAFNTYVNDIPAYKMTAGDIEKEVTDGLKKYSLTIHARGDITDVISSEDISLSLRMDDQFEDALKKQNAFLWPANLFKDTYITTDNIVVYSRDVVEKKINTLQLLNAANIIEPANAYIPEASGEDGFYIVPEDQGRSPIREKVVEKICAALDVLEGEVTIDDECYNTPEIYSDNAELNTFCNNLNTYCKAQITYEFGADTVVVDGTKIREWLNINGTEVSLDEEKVREFVNSLAKQYDTFGKNRTITSHSGEQVTVTGGDYGWWMDRATETTELIAAIKNGEKGVRTPVYFGTAAQYGENDWGNSYVEIDLTAQHLWVYQDGAMVMDSDFVSGCVNKKRTTPRGSYAITYKERDATLVGENYSSAVSYWMPFNGNVGMHDASWRSQFGGYDYILNGSHGCINLPTANAEKIYEIVSKGEAVFVYGGITDPVPVVEQEVVDPNTGEVKVVRKPVINGKIAGTDTPANTNAPAAESTPAENQAAEAPAAEGAATDTETSENAGAEAAAQNTTPEASAESAGQATENQAPAAESAPAEDQEPAAESTPAENQEPAAETPAE